MHTKNHLTKQYEKGELNIIKIKLKESQRENKLEIEKLNRFIKIRT